MSSSSLISLLKMLYVLGSSQIHFLLSLEFKVILSAMAQDGSIELQASRDVAPAPIACETHYGEPAKLEILNTTESPEMMDYDDQPLKHLSQQRSEIEAGDDDEVQFVFSAPRRKRRKRRRYENSKISKAVLILL